MPRIRIRKPSDDKLPPGEVALLLVFLAVIGVLVAWGLGWF